MIDKFNESLYKIEEAYNGHYSVKIQMDSDSDILNLIDDSYKYVWIIGHSEYLNEWTLQITHYFHVNLILIKYL